MGRMNLVLTLALILTFSPGEKEKLLDGSGLADGCPANSIARIIQNSGGCESPLLGERVG